jgi:hypothetical protein
MCFVMLTGRVHAALSPAPDTVSHPKRSPHHITGEEGVLPSIMRLVPPHIHTHLSETLLVIRRAVLAMQSLHSFWRHLQSIAPLSLCVSLSLSLSLALLLRSCARRRSGTEMRFGKGKIASVRQSVAETASMKSSYTWGMDAFFPGHTRKLRDDWEALEVS